MHLHGWVFHFLADWLADCLTDCLAGLLSGNILDPLDPSRWNPCSWALSLILYLPLSILLFYWRLIRPLVSSPPFSYLCCFCCILASYVDNCHASVPRSQDQSAVQPPSGQYSRRRRKYCRIYHPSAPTQAVSNTMITPT